MGSSVAGLMRWASSRLRPQELSTLTAEGRARERYRRVGMTALASMGARGIGIATALISIPLTVRYLGPEQYGLWVTITSVTALVGFADFGLSNGLVNGVSEAHGKNDMELARQYVSSAFCMLVVVTLVLGVAFAVTYRFIPWPRVFNVQFPDAAAVAGPAMAVFVTTALVSLPLGVIGSIRAGYQEGFASSVWQGAGSVISLIGLVIAIASQADLPWLVLAIGVGPAVAALLNAAFLFRRRPWLTPSVRRATLPAVRRMLRLGLMFFVLAIAFAVAYQTDNIVIAQILGAEQVTQYAVPMKLFMLAPLILSFALTPLWPAYGEALTRRDYAWVRRTLTRSIAAAATISLSLATALVMFGRPILHAWAGNAITPTTPLLLALGAWAVVSSVSGAIAMYLNGANALGFQVGCAAVMMTANLLLSIVLTRVVGISGPAWGSVIAVILFVLFPSTMYLRSTLKGSHQKETE